ncbi:Ig-like domain-containing protein [Anaerofustis stercorihominis]|uniref:Ig-like domain-containing protein n=1 Tax=Anaerofustis stercorihominis TaxID=214853 RepID=UPI00214B9E63|nr:Ig-like domain-containing protein [Anaerofustis stercorihominis]MCR2033571.1 Ig-like domain-containing protein [Anaerofustis stercorihominis]
MKKSKRFIAVLLALMLMITIVPSLSFAMDEDGEMMSQEQTVVSDEVKNADDSEVVDVTKNEADKNAIDEEKNNNKSSDEKSVQSDVKKSTSVKESKSSTPYYYIEYKQEKVNYTNVEVYIPMYDKLTQKGYADKAKVVATMSYAGQTTKSYNNTITLSSLSAKSGKVSIKFPAYGKWNVKTEFYKGSKKVYTTKNTNIGIKAEEYNLASLCGTFPVTYATLKLWDITKNASGDPIPTFMVLERPYSYDWNELPENVYEVPYIKNPNHTKWESIAPRTANQMAAYVKDLYSLDNNAKFHLYSVDIYSYTILALFYKNRIPESNFEVTMLSDGTGSYWPFNSVFNVANPQDRYNEMKQTWENLKKEAYDTQKIPDLSKIPYTNGATTTGLIYYPYVIAKEEGYEWWVARTDAFNIQNADMLSDVKSVATRVNINDLLNALKAKGLRTELEFKALYNFNDSYFEKAEKENKKVMLFLGTTVGNTVNVAGKEQDFKDYARFTMAYYGDKYIYYYKGHPATPTDLYQWKQDELKNLDVIDIESAMAAELILYFYPDAYLSGYSTSVFENTNDVDKKCGLFNCTKSASSSFVYGKDMDYYCSKITASSEESIKKLCSGASSDFKGFYLIEFNDNVSKSFNTAIWNANNSTITYYQKDGNNYKFVKKEDSVKSRNITTAKTTYTVYAGAKPFSLSAKTTGTADFSYKSSNTNIATVNSNGVVTPKKPGKVTIRIDVAATGFYKNASKDVTIIVKSKERKITTSKSTYKIYVGAKRFPLFAKTIGSSSFSYTSSNKNVANVSSKGIVVPKNPGKVTIKINVKASGIYDKAFKNVNVIVAPKKGKITKLISKGNKRLGVRFAKDIKSSGYQIVVARNKRFTQNKKTINVKSYKTTGVNFSKLKSKSKYYVRVRSYKTISGKKYYGPWSSVKAIRTR